MLLARVTLVTVRVGISTHRLLTRFIPEIPSLHPSYGTLTPAQCAATNPAAAITNEPGGGNHTPGFTAIAATPHAHAVTLDIIKALTLTGIRVLNDDAFFAKASCVGNPCVSVAN